MKWERDIELLTPCFCRGAYPNQPEIRVPPIRGMVRWWFRQLEYQFASTSQQQHPQQLVKIFETEKQLFGGVHGGTTASRLVFRVSNVHTQLPTRCSILPHKQDGQTSLQNAFPRGCCFHLTVTSRFSSLPDELRRRAENALEVWLLLGSLGLRGNRGSGSVWPADDSAPKTAADLKSKLTKAGLKNWSVALVGLGKNKQPDDLRKTASDTLKGNPYRDIFGSIKPRLSSPTKFKVIRLEDGFCLLACAPHEKILREAERLLKNKPQPQAWQNLGDWNYIFP